MGTQLGHMQIHKNKHFKFLVILWVGLLLFVQNIFAANPICTRSQQDEFRKLYIELQKNLNYEGKDAFLDSKGVLQLKAHEAGKDYEGKLFEQALFREYQNTLRKVGKIYQMSLDPNDDKKIKQNPDLVGFFRALEKSDSESQQYIVNTQIKKVIDALAETSRQKFTDDKDKKFLITDNDRYMLEKLLTHAQDRIVTLTEFNRTNKGTSAFKDVDYLKKIKNAPLNRLINSLKKSGIKDDSLIEMSDATDTDNVIRSAVAQHMNNLVNWVKQNKHCEKMLRSRDFVNRIQKNIQFSNYNFMLDSIYCRSKSLDTIDPAQINNLESILHFINANEQFGKTPQAKAETALDEVKLEGFISSAFDNLATRIRCLKFEPNQSKEKLYFLQNLPYDESTNKFDTTNIECLQGKVKIARDKCEKMYKLVSDRNGRGLQFEIKPGVKNLSFNIKNGAGCDGIESPPAPPVPRPITPPVEYNDNYCNKLGESLNPKQHLIYDPEVKKDGCTPLSNDICKKRGLAKTPDKEGWFLDLKTHSCQKINADYCKSQLDEEKKQPMIVSPDGLSCVKKNEPLLTEDACRKKGDETPNGPILTLDTESKQCIPLTDNICGARGLKMQPPKYLVFDQDTKKCEENSQEICEKRGKAKTPKEGWYFDISKNSCQKISDEYCGSLKDKEGKPKVLSDDKLSCIDAKKEPILSVLDDKQCKAKDPKTYFDEVTKACKAYDQAYCDAQSKDDKKLVLKKDGTGCEPKPQEYTDEICSKQNKDGKTFKAKADKSGCEEVKPVVDPHAKAKEDCLKSQADFVKSQGGLPTTKYRWNSTTNKCDDLKPDPKAPSDDEEEDETYYDFKVNNTRGPVPPRFVPKSLLPMRMSIDGGMP